MELNSEEIKRHKEILCETMKAFIAFCNKYHLQYFACAGTCLGAIRHKGIIPWDDDIDVLMPRKDYNKFLSLKSQLSGTSYNIVDPTTKGYYLSFAKFENINTTIYEVCEYPFVFGVFIDVFPLDEVGDELVARQLFRRRSKIWNHYNFTLSRFVPSVFTDFRINYGLKVALKYFVYSTLGGLMREFLYKGFVANEHVIQKQRGDKCMCYGGSYGFEKELCDKEWFGEGLEVPFEDFSIIVPKMYDAYLKHFYKDYMTPPPIEQRVTHHNQYFVDLAKRWSVEDVLKLNLGKQTKKTYKYE